MKRRSTLTTIRERNKRKRLIGWIAFYLLLIATFALIVYWQAKRVNTLGFANGAVQITTSKPKYTLGDTIRYTVKNNLDQPITFTTNCPREPLFVYSWTNNAWVRIHDTADAAACADELPVRTILPGDSYSQSFANWPNLFNKPGIYRIVGFVSNYTALPYADFQVVAKPVAPTVQTQVIIQKVITPIYITSPTNAGEINDR